MTLEQRAEAYATAFPKYPRVVADKGWLIGTWLFGQPRVRTDQTIYGGYPGNFLRRTLSMFEDAERTLHLFSGNVPESLGFRVDLDPARRPSVVADARRLPFVIGSFDLVVADPPYSSEDAKNYGFPMVSRRHVMHEIRGVVKAGGHLCWLDATRPMYRSTEWEQVGAIAVIVSTNTRIRMLSVFRAKGEWSVAERYR